MEEKLGTKHWYIATTYAGRERRVAENIKKVAESHNLGQYFFRTLVAEHEVPVMRNGKPTGKTKIENDFPGYIFVEMIMNTDTWWCVRNAQDCTGIVGSHGAGTMPTPVTVEDMEAVLKKAGQIDTSMYSDYNVGDTVIFISGSFNGNEGTIEAIDQANGMLTVTTVFFGRLQTVEVSFADIKKE